MAETCGISEGIRFLGESLGFWAQTASFTLSAIAAVIIIYHNGLLARRRATVDHIIHQKSDPDLLAAIDKVHRLRESEAALSGFVTNREGSEYKSILKVLNNYEFIALGIKRSAFDERIYKELQCSNFIKIWNSTSGLISEIRKTEQIETLFQEFEWLAKRWKKAPLKAI